MAKKMEKMLMSRTCGMIKRTAMMEYIKQERIITKNTTGERRQRIHSRKSCCTFIDTHLNTYTQQRHHRVYSKQLMFSKQRYSNTNTVNSKYHIHSTF